MGTMIGIHQQSGALPAYLAIPTTPTYRGAVLIAHELWGLTDAIKRIADRLATNGYYVLAPDFLSTTDALQRKFLSPNELQHAALGDDKAKRMSVAPQMRTTINRVQTPQFASQMMARLESCFEYLYNQPLVHQKVAVLGFDLGGSYVYRFAMHEPRLKCSISFYGHMRYIESELRHIRSPILAFYGAKDPLTAEFQHMLPRITKAGVNFRHVIYPEAKHSFFDEANLFVYDEKASNDALHQSISFLRQYMY